MDGVKMFKLMKGRGFKMDILNQNNKDKSVNKPEIEQQEKEKQEYKLIGRFIRRKGMKLFQYNPTKDEIIEIDIQPKTQMVLAKTKNGLDYIDIAQEEATVDSNQIHFESLNWKNAKKRVKKYKKGKLKELSNIRTNESDAINPFTKFDI